MKEEKDFALVLRELSKLYENGFQALSGINLEVESGDFFALLGGDYYQAHPPGKLRGTLRPRGYVSDPSHSSDVGPQDVSWCVILIFQSPRH